MARVKQKLRAALDPNVTQAEEQRAIGLAVPLDAEQLAAGVGAIKLRLKILDPATNAEPFRSRGITAGRRYQTERTSQMAPDAMLSITPSWVPFAPHVIAVTGLCEIAGSVALVTGYYRYAAGIALAIYALCVWPANFKHAIDGIAIPHIANSWLYHGPRLAFQPVIIWWAL